MARGRDDEIVEEYVGIHTTTYEVEQVSVWRSGKMTGPRGLAHHAGNRRPDNEILVVFNLIDTFSYPVQMWNSDWVKQKREELKAKAAAMKARSSS